MSPSNVYAASEALHDEINLATKNKASEPINEQDIVLSIQGNITLLSKLVEVVTTANQLGKKGKSEELKGPDEVSDLIALAVNGINNKEEKMRSRDEWLLMRLYGKANDQELSLPDWFRHSQLVINQETDTKNLPAPEDLARSVPNKSVQLDGLISKCNELNNTYLELKGMPDDGSGEVGVSGSKTNAALKEWYDEQDKVVMALLEIAPDPNTLPLYGDNIGFYLSPTAEVIKPIAEYFESLGHLIVELAKKSDDPLPEDFKFANITPKLSEETNQLSGIEATPLTSLSSISREKLQEKLPEILEAYISLREVLLQIHQLHNKASSAPDRSSQNAYQQTNRIIVHCLSSVFPTKSFETLDALMERKDDEAIRAPLRKLLFSKSVSDGSKAEASIFIADTKLTHLLPEVTRAVLDGDEVSIEQLQKNAGAFRPFVELSLQLKDFLAPDRRRKLPDFLDTKLERCGKKSGAAVSAQERLALLVALAEITKDEDLARILRTGLRKKALVSGLAEQISGSIYRDETPEGQFIGNLKIRIEQKFLPRLADYWGQKKLKEQFYRAVNEHLTLLRNPEIWKGLQSKTVFFNGHLIYGKPGVGKGYLLECMANEFGLPIETVTREQLEEAIPEEKKGNLKELEAVYAKFLDERIEVARGKMKKFGSDASFIFIDEMEAEFLNRNAQGVDQAQINRTNIMLRVIEKKIAENPDIIFVGATNYIHRVDEAARRIGRFGIPWKVELTGEEDAKEILTGNFNLLGIDPKQAEEQEGYENLVKKCFGFTPLTISQSVTNYVCLRRAQDGDDSVRELNNDNIREIIENIDVLKSRFDKRDEELKKDGIEVAP
jgi:SpoVK/Ycf46/Vps4 family AAA+-type ATPase